MSAKIAVLGLVIEEPGPAYRLTAKLRQRLASAGFVDSNVYSALTRLEREGLIRGVKVHSADGEPGAASAKKSPASGSESQHFEATPAGVRCFEEWLLESTVTPPLRDELHMKIALCQPRNVPRMVDLLYGQELVCIARVRELRASYEKAQPPEPHRWQGLVMVLMRDAEISFWESRIAWLQGLRASLEQVRDSFESASRGRPAA
jgi:DNA-binding PadR family transcriptional regulator